MKINGQMPIQKILKTYEQNHRVDKSKKKALETDRVEISDKAREIQVAMKALADVPEIREERVREIKEAIENDTYKPTGRDIVDQLFKSKKVAD